jgi:hypothetical protein
VPLARLQEVFLTLQPRNRIQLLEVIRILGPFPNVKNVLQGSHESTLINTPVEALDLPWQHWEITWNSMIDGMGKEILAGQSERVRKVSLQVAFCHPKVLVAVLPPPATATETMNAASALAMGKNQARSSKKLSSQPVRSDPLEDNGSHVLVFVRDEDMQDKLEKLRVA